MALPREGEGVPVGVVFDGAVLPTLGSPSEVWRRLDDGEAREGERLLPDTGTGAMCTRSRA
jgi:hypothetical protein